MSDRPTNFIGKGSDYPKLALTCDVPGCLRQVRRAPRICLP